jgi:hypothetical protein
VGRLSNSRVVGWFLVIHDQPLYEAWPSPCGRRLAASSWRENWRLGYTVDYARLINSFALIYPIASKREFDPIVEGIEKTFRPGQDCGRHAAR